MQSKEYQLMYQLEDQHWWFVAKRRYIQTYLSLISWPKSTRILDIGCGTGRNLKLLSRYGQAQGVDYSPQAIKFCQNRGLLIKKASADNLPFQSNSFNLVTLFDVLYHRGIKNDLKALKQAHRVLKSGGYLLLTDCAHQFLYGPHDQAQHARQRYSKKELLEKASKAGFRLKRSSYIYCVTFPVFLIKRLVSKYLAKTDKSDVEPTPKIINQLLISLLQLEAKALKYFNLPFGSSIMILAQK